jgi:hypothetical protein
MGVGHLDVWAAKCMHVLTHAHTHTHTHIHTHTRTHLLTHTQTQTHTHSFTPIHTHPYTHTFTHILTHKHTPAEAAWPHPTAQSRPNLSTPISPLKGRGWAFWSPHIQHSFAKCARRAPATTVKCTLLELPALLLLLLLPMLLLALLLLRVRNAGRDAGADAV